MRRHRIKCILAGEHEPCIKPVGTRPTGCIDGARDTGDDPRILIGD